MVHHCIAAAFVLTVLTSSALATASTAPATRAGADEALPARRQVELAPGEAVEYLITAPARPTAPADRWMVVFLHGAGGSLKSYNLARQPYARIRQALAENGAYVVVPALGPAHFMNDQAKVSLDGVIGRVLADHQIDPERVHLMGTSMGAGSSLAYAVNRPGRVRSVCAIMPMTDFADWVRENSKYAARLKEAYGGTPEEKPEAYDANSALKQATALATVPVLLVHGTADTTVAFRHSERLAAKLQSLGQDCTLIPVQDGRHSDDIVTKLQDRIVQFLMNANAER